MSILQELFYPKVYSVPLVILSILIAIFASFTAFGTSERQFSAVKTSHKIMWNLFGAIAMGLGTWAMHFIGMMALELPIPVTYDLFITIISVTPSIFACSIVLWVMTQRELTSRRTLIGGVVLGAGIGLMHHSGMFAMQMNAIMTYDMTLLILSILFAVLFAIVALKIQYQATDIKHYQFINKT